MAIALVIGAWDLFLFTDGETGNTISSVVQGEGWAIGLIGFTAVHLARKPDPSAKKKTWGLTIAGAVVAAGASQAIGGGIEGLTLGGATGWVTWGNSGKT